MTADVIRQAVAYIHSQQQLSGNFIDDNNSPALFYTSLIASALSHTTDAMSSRIKDRAVEFLLKQKSSNWSWNYWQRDTTSPYPDDLDDTFVALQAITASRSGALDETAWFALTTLLIENETAPGGPYYTWVMGNTARITPWDDSDIVVNANIAIFLRSHGIVLPALELFFEKNSIEDTISSLYYDEEYIVIYFLSKAYGGIYKNLLKEKILSRRNTQGCWNSPLENAFAISSLIRLGEDPTILNSAIHYLIDHHHDGMWRSTPFFIDRRRGADTIYSSCSAYVSACCVEALTLYNEALGTSGETREALFIKDVIVACKNHFSNFSPILQKQAHYLIDFLITKDPKQEIILLPLLFSEQLSFPVDPNMVFSLAVANVLGWIGYSVKDAIQDGEPQQEFLACATLCIRKSIAVFHSCATDYFSKEDINDILDSIEEALVWEYTHCHLGAKLLSGPAYGDYRMLADKSFGHAIGPLSLASLSGDQQQIEYVRTFFQHYIIARQMHDDAHDWQEDLDKGYINSVSSLFITKENYQRPVAELNELFWQKYIDTACATITKHIAQARSAIQNITILADSDVLSNLLIPLDLACEQAIAERSKARNFLEIMQSQ